MPKDVSSPGAWGARRHPPRWLQSYRSPPGKECACLRAPGVGERKERLTVSNSGQGTASPIPVTDPSNASVVCWERNSELCLWGPSWADNPPFASARQRRPGSWRPCGSKQSFLRAEMISNRLGACKKSCSRQRTGVYITSHAAKLLPRYRTGSEEALQFNGWFEKLPPVRFLKSSV